MPVTPATGAAIVRLLALSVIAPVVVSDPPTVVAAPPVASCVRPEELSNVNEPVPPETVPVVEIVPPPDAVRLVPVTAPAFTVPSVDMPVTPSVPPTVALFVTEAEFNVARLLVESVVKAPVFGAVPPTVPLNAPPRLLPTFVAVTAPVRVVVVPTDSDPLSVMLAAVRAPSAVTAKLPPGFVKLPPET